MINRILPLLMLTFCGVLLAQDSTSVPQTVPTLPPPEDPIQPKVSWLKPASVSTTPTAQELADLFIGAGRGEFDPFEVIGALNHRQDNGVSGLTELLFSETITETPPKTGAESVAGEVVLQRPNKLYAVLCLRAIGSNRAYETLLRAAEVDTISYSRDTLMQTTEADSLLQAAQDSIRNIRGTALVCFAEDYLQKIRRENFTPDKEIIYLFLKNIGNPGQVEFLQRSLDAVARGGLTSWTDKDFTNEIIPSGELWWLENKDRLIWNQDKGRFEIK